MVCEYCGKKENESETFMVKIEIHPIRSSAISSVVDYRCCIACVDKVDRVLTRAIGELRLFYREARASVER